MVENDYNLLMLDRDRNTTPAVNLLNWFGMQNITTDYNMDLMAMYNPEIRKFLDKEKVNYRPV